jgi:hypothetical protein
VASREANGLELNLPLLGSTGSGLALAELLRLPAHVDDGFFAEMLAPVVDCFRQGPRIAWVVCEVENLRVPLRIDHGCINLPAGRRHNDRFHEREQSAHAARVHFRPELVQIVIREDLVAGFGELFVILP